MREVVSQNTDQLGVLMVGFVVAFVSAYIVIKWLIKYLQNNSLVLFGWYRIIASIILLVVLWLYP
jgi:undecaprenyl-diphosphatase